MKTVKINYVDFPNVNKEEHLFTKILRQRYDVQICSDPDYLFFGPFGSDNLTFDGIKIFYTGEDISPDFNLCDYAIAFDRLQFGDRYLRYPIFAMRDAFRDAQQKHLFTQADLDNKTGFCNFVYSNSQFADPIRRQFFETLSCYKRVDSGGRFLNNIGGPIGKTIADKLDFQSKYKFSIAFENGQSDGYTTEKIIEAFAAKTIPIYWGDPGITEDLNEKAFVNCGSFASLDEVVERVREIDNDDALFREMLAQPIFGEENDPEQFSRERLEQFLFAIFDQPLSSARRRGRHTRKDFYVSDMAKKYAFFEKMTGNPFSKIMKRIYGSFCGIFMKIKRR